MYAEKILKSLELRKSKAYVPAFRIEREERGWRVFDRKTAIAFFMPYSFDIWSFSPFEPAEIANAEPPGAVWDLHTLHNTYMNLAAHGWPASWRKEAGDPALHLKWTWLKKSGPELLAKVDGRFAGGEQATWLLGVRYDPKWGRYRYTYDATARKNDPQGFEILNMMTAGALQARAEDRRWTDSIWEDPEGRLRRVPHSNALFTCTDYGRADWRTRNAPLHGAWIAYAAHKSFNPTMVIHSTNIALRFATCSQLFDEHVIWSDAGQDEIGADGYFHFNISAELVNMKPALARELLRRATPPIKPARWQKKAVPLPFFFMDRVNSFEKPVDSWKAEECPIMVVPAEPDGPVRWASDAAHAGRRSICITGDSEGQRRELFPTGAVCNVKPHRRYRLSGWIRTRGVQRLARLELSSYQYGYSNTIAAASSADVAGTTDWTQVSVDLDSGDEAYLMPRLVLYGPGAAWFDDVMLEELSR